LVKYSLICWRVFTLIGVTLLTTATFAATPVNTAMLTPCPDSPNCVCSDGTGDHAIAPFKFSGPPDQAWQAAKKALLSLPRTKIINETERTLRAESTSLIFRFVDDVEFELRAAQGIIAVRSASRVGYSDLGANRRRIEAIRAAYELQMTKN
jgi:uncharacterized protein (DUF1499 family)